MSLRKYVTSPDARGARQRSDRSTPSACSDSRLGFPTSNAKLPGCRAEEEHLFERRDRGRRAPRWRQSSPDRQPLPDGAAGRRDRPVREIPLRLAKRRVVRRVDAAAELERHVRPRDLFVQRMRPTRSDRQPATALRRRRRRTPDRAPTRRHCPSSARTRDGLPDDCSSVVSFLKACQPPRPRVLHACSGERRPSRETLRTRRSGRSRPARTVTLCLRGVNCRCPLRRPGCRLCVVVAVARADVAPCRRSMRRRRCRRRCATAS